MHKVSVNGLKFEVYHCGVDAFVDVRQVCQDLGVDAQFQEAKLKMVRWASTMTIGEQLYLHLDGLPMWLASLDAGEVKPDVRARLDGIQAGASGALRDNEDVLRQAARGSAFHAAKP